MHTEDDFPREWARIQGNLGVAYHALGDGDLEANLRRSVASYDAALRVYSSDDADGLAEAQAEIDAAIAALPPSGAG